MRIIRTAFVFLSLILLAAPEAGAVTIFSNFGPSDSFNESAGWTLNTGPTFGYSTQGEGFVPLATYRLDQLELALSLVDGPNLQGFQLREDDGGVPGRVLERYDLIGRLEKRPAIHTIPSVVRPVLGQGDTYWLIGDTYPADHELVVWHNNSIGGTGPHAHYDNSGFRWLSETNVQSAFRVSGTPVIPEPATLMLLSMGVLSLSFAKRSA